MRIIQGDQVILIPAINTGQFDERYLLNSQIYTLDSIFVTSGEFQSLDTKYVRITGNDQTINLNRGLTVSGAPLVVRSSGIFESGINIRGDLIINGRKVLIQAEGAPFSIEAV